MNVTTEEHIRALREALAKNPTPGRWEVAYVDKHGQAVVKSEHFEVATCWHHCVGAIEKQMVANAALIAAAHPAAILAVLAALEAAQRDAERLRKAAEAVVGRWDTPLWKEAQATAVSINALRAAITGA